MMSPSISSDQEKLRLLYAAVYVGLELIPKSQQPEIITDTRLPSLSKVVGAFKRELGSVDLKRAHSKFRWMTRDSSDKLLLRYLRQAGDVPRAAGNLAATIKYELKTNTAQILKRGEEYYIGTDPDPAYIEQYKQSKAMIVGHDSQLQPLFVVRVKVHFPGNQSKEACQRLVSQCFETANMVQQDERDGGTLVFDLTDFTLQNMDYSLVHFIITNANRYYPNLVSVCYVHNAPRFFEAMWKVIRPWIASEIRDRVKFTYKTTDLLKTIPMDQLPRHLGGYSGYDSSQWVDPRPEDDVMLHEAKGRQYLTNQRESLLFELEQLTTEWIFGERNEELRENVLAMCKLNYWNLDPYLRSRIIWDRHGILGSLRPELSQGGIAQPSCITVLPVHSPLPGENGQASPVVCRAEERVHTRATSAGHTTHQY